MSSDFIRVDLLIGNIANSIIRLHSFSSKNNLMIGRKSLILLFCLLGAFKPIFICYEFNDSETMGYIVFVQRIW